MSRAGWSHVSPIAADAFAAPAEQMDHQPDGRQAERDRHELPREHVRLVRRRDVAALEGAESKLMIA